MHISQLILRDFGKFTDFTVDFTPGINLVKGPNEAGKSTLAAAVTMALFSQPASDSQRVTGIARWGEGKAPILEAILNIDGANYKLVRDFDKGVSNIEPKNIALPGGEKADLNSWLSEKLGISSEEIFESTACIKQGMINHIDNSIEAIKDKLESLVTKGNEEQATSSTLNKIRERIRSISENDGQEGWLKTQEEEISYNIEKLERDISTLRGKRAELVQLETTHVNIQDDLSSRKKKLEMGLKAAEVSQRMDDHNAEVNRLQRQTEAAKEPGRKIEELKSQRSSLKRITRDDLAEIEQMESRLAYLRPKRSGLEEDTLEADEELQSYKIGSLSIFATVLGLLASGFFVGNYYLQLVPDILPHLYYSLVGSAGTFLLGLTVLQSRRQHKRYLSKKHEKLAEKLENLKKDIEEREKNLATRLQNYLAPSVNDLKKNQWQYEEIEKQLEKATKQYNEIMAGSTMSDLESRLASLENEAKVVTGENEEMAQHHVDPTELEREKLAVNEIEERLKDLVRGRTTLIQQIEMAEGGSELLASYMERKERLKQEYGYRKYHLSVLELTLQCIEEARQNALVSKLEILNNRVSEILDGLTGGRYTKVRFDKSNLKFEAWSGDRGEWVDPEKWLSSGTVDQIYFAARLALADLISDERNSILILDDPFANFDDNRLGNAMKVLKGLSQNHQILLLTSHDHYDSWADSTINL